MNSIERRASGDHLLRGQPEWDAPPADDVAGSAHARPVGTRRQIHRIAGKNSLSSSFLIQSIQDWEL